MNLSQRHFLRPLIGQWKQLATVDESRLLWKNWNLFGDTSLLPGLAGSPEKFTLHRGSPESSVVAVGIHLDSAVEIFRTEILLAGSLLN